MRTFFLRLLIVILAIGGWLTWTLWAPMTPEGQKFVLLRPGFSTRRIAAELRNAGVIRNQYAFILWHRFHHQRTLKAGEYLFDKSANALDVHDRLALGDVYVHTVVIPEGFTMFDIASAIQGAGLGSRQEFLDVATHDVALVADLDPGARSLEGYLFPATYEFTRTETMHDMAAAMVKQFHQVAQEIALTDDVRKIVIMGSIIEKETSVPEERPVVGSVYYNRLERNIALQADPSVIYAELLAGTYTGALHHEDMLSDSPYNTYKHPGLPPGPIGNPGKSSLEAAMHPATTDYYYFVSDGSGHHRFSSSLEEHNRNVAQYRKTMQGR